MRKFADGMYNRRQFAPPPSDTIDALALAASTSERVAVPTGATWVIMSADGNFFAKYGTDNTVVATVPGDTTNGTAAELNPEARQISDGITHIAVIATAATIVTFSWYGD